MEKALNGKMGLFLDKTLRKLTVDFWQKKFRTMERAQYNRDMQASDGVSKHHPNGFRDRVLTEHQKQLETFKKKINELLMPTPSS
ncbi:MAG: hypothetical protein IPP71_00840 [Bacteroidetes bacterium]|nr:hypothetical protein [Bacteroidota bacterium]